MATEAVRLDKDAFMRLVTEERLQVEGPSVGNLYAGRKGVNGWELFRTNGACDTPAWTYDATANDSDKSFTVPAGKIWEILSIHGEMTCSADVGNRQLWIVITNGTNTVWASVKTANITASQVGCIEAFNLATYTTTAAQIPTLAGAAPNIGARVPLPTRMILPAGYVIRVYDFAALAPAADDLTVSIHYTEKDA